MVDRKNYGIPLVREIDDQVDALSGLNPTQKQRTKDAMKLGAMLEGGSLTGPWGVGDQGTSFGPFQIHNALPKSQADDPATAVSYMKKRYANAVKNAPASVWGNYLYGVEQAVYKAERPAKDYLDTVGPSTIEEKWTSLTGTTEKVSAPPKDSSTSIFSDVVNQTGDVLGGAFSGITSSLGMTAKIFEWFFVPNNVTRVVLFIVGSILVLVGIFFIGKDVAG